MTEIFENHNVPNISQQCSGIIYKKQMWHQDEL